MRWWKRYNRRRDKYPSTRGECVDAIRCWHDKVRRDVRITTPPATDGPDDNDAQSHGNICLCTGDVNSGQSGAIQAHTGASDGSMSGATSYWREPRAMGMAVTLFSQQEARTPPTSS